MNSRTRQKASRQLRLHRETMRALTDEDLGRAAGGSYAGLVTSVLMMPKTNGWSSDTNATCAS